MRCKSALHPSIVQARTASLVTLMGYRARGEVGGQPVVKVELTNPLSGSAGDLGARVTGIVGVPTRTIASRAKLTALQAALKTALETAREEHGLSRVKQYIINFENCTFQQNVIHQNIKRGTRTCRTLRSCGRS